MKEEKSLLLDEVKSKIEESNGFVVISYKGLTAVLSRLFRNTLFDLDGEFEVVKKTIFLKAAESAGVSVPLEDTEGHMGVLFGKQDIAQLAKNIIEFNKKNNNVFKILGGRIEESSYTSEEMDAIAALPGIKELRAQFVGLIQAPLANVVGVVQAVLTSVLNCMEEKIKKNQE
ncbi:50S ribosomal protein L10 [Candidatus Clavichlamydia salmonicola]|uniref:50S ribosomal protein L10 n=1 Tax=Candidatus Clavichlamydia salmonicola TaxID=469812 RepID=UPI001891AA06|nr:50S ribosomal protein L10 [Candidatus Clavichlamydia salmonicola]MBF5051103.1 50S ribosomal protein L10 [Candidatus Clavichlamydia salmonicola]